MGLRDKIQAKAGQAFDKALADAVTPFSCTREVVTGGYDPETGTTPQTTIGYQGRGVFGGFRQHEIDGSRILATDTKITALQNEIWRVENGEVTNTPDAPQIDDVVNGLTVVDVRKDPADAAWVIQARRT